MRHLDWEPRLAAYVESRRTAAFEFGQNDCVSFARSAIVAMGGDDPCPDLTWSNEAEAEQLLSQGLEDLVTRYLGPPVPVRCVQRGGVLLLDHGRGLGLKVGSRACMPGEFDDHAIEDIETEEFAELEVRTANLVVYRKPGLVFLPLKRFTKGWNTP